MGFGSNRQESPPIYERKNYRINMVAAREQLNLSQAELARRVGCSRSRIAGIECGIDNLTIKLAKKIADVLSIDDYRELEETFNFSIEKGLLVWTGSNGTKIRVKPD